MNKVRIILRAIFTVIIVLPLLVPAIAVIGITEWLLSGKTDISVKYVVKGIYTFIVKYEIDGVSL